MPISKNNSGAARSARNRNLQSQKLDALKRLKDGWDSYSAPAPSTAAIDNAKALCDQANRLGTSPDRVEPSAMGGVGMTFCLGNREAVIEFYNNGTAQALFADDSTGEMHTQAIPTTAAGYRRLINDVRKHLHGEENAA
jgi:hypothetical protein